MICCICKKEIKGYAHNPDGAVGPDGKAIQWEKNDMCCDDCNSTYVIPGRIALLTRNTEYVSKVCTKDSHD